MVVVVVAVVVAIAIAATVVVALPLPILFKWNNLCYAIDACLNAVINSGPNQCRNAPLIA
jgi:hypothetical protein